MKESYYLIFFYRRSTRMQQSATGCHRAAEVLGQNPTNLPKSMLPPAQECQIDHLATLVIQWSLNGTRALQQTPKVVKGL